MAKSKSKVETKQPETIVGKIFTLLSPLTKCECNNRSTGETGSFAAGERVEVEGIYDCDRLTITCPDDKDGRPIVSPDGSLDPFPGYMFLVSSDELCKAAGIEPIGKQFDLVGKIMAYEDNQMDGPETVEFFQHLIDNDMLGGLQGHYGRMAKTLIAAGHCKPKSRMN